MMIILINSVIGYVLPFDMKYQTKWIKAIKEAFPKITTTIKPH